jgi:hypothetical protein
MGFWREGCGTNQVSFRCLVSMLLFMLLLALQAMASCSSSAEASYDQAHELAR